MQLNFIYKNIYYIVFENIYYFRISTIKLYKIDKILDILEKYFTKNKLNVLLNSELNKLENKLIEEVNKKFKAFNEQLLALLGIKTYSYDQFIINEFKKRYNELDKVMENLKSLNIERQNIKESLKLIEILKEKINNIDKEIEKLLENIRINNQTMNNKISYVKEITKEIEKLKTKLEKNY